MEPDARKEPEHPLKPVVIAAIQGRATAIMPTLQGTTPTPVQLGVRESKTAPGRMKMVFALPFTFGAEDEHQGLATFCDEFRWESN